MNILLVRPPDPLQHASLLSHTRPMNLAYLAAFVREQGFSVTIVDYETKPFDAGAYRRLLAEKKPSIVGVSCVTPTIGNGALICSLTKSYDRNIVTVAGGPHSNSLPAETLREFPAFDCLIYGEGEETLAELCRRIAEGSEDRALAGLVYRKKDGEVVKNPPRDLVTDLDTLPFPARDLIDYREQPGHSTRGFSNRIRSTELFTSRGCPFGCSFCAIQSTFGRTARFRDLSFIREEVDLIVNSGFNHLVIADDTFTLGKDRAFGLCDTLGGSGIKSWNCDTRVTSVSKELLLAMRKSGCQKVAFGVESGSQRVLDLIGKKITVEEVRQAVSWAREAGIRHIEGNFIIGSDPTETPEEVNMTAALIRTLPWTFVSVSVIVPYPGTPVARRMAELGLIRPDAAWDDYVMIGAPPKWRTMHFTAQDLVRLQRTLTRRFYLNPAYIVRQLSAIRSFREVRYWVSAGASYLKWYYSGKL